MAFTEALRLIIDADTRGAVRGIQQVGATTERELGRSQKSLDKWGKGLTTAGAGMIALGGAALFGLGKAAMASEEANLATVKLENTLRNMPALAGENSKQFTDLAESIQSKTAADADAIVEAEALLGTFRLTADEIKAITPLVVDYARKFGVDLPSAATQVGKALDGNIGALRRVGISIDETAFAADRFGAVQSALRDQVGGFAEEEGKTFAGSLERLKNQLGDLAEGVGAGAVDAFSSMFGVVDGLTDRLNDLSPETQNMIGKFATFGSVALIAAGGLSFTIGQLIKMRDNFILAREAVVSFAGSGGLGRLARVSLVIGGFVALREVLMALDNDLEGIDVSTLENELLDLAETGKLSGEQLAGIFEGFNEAIESGDPQKIEAISNQLNEVDKALAQLTARDPEAAAAAFRFISESLRDMGASSEQVKAFFNDYASAVAQADTASRTAAGGVGELAGGMGDQAGETTAAQQALQEYSDTLHGLFDPLFGATDALMDNAEAQAAVRAAELELIAATREHGATSAEATEAEQKLAAAHLASGKSALDLRGAMAELRAGVEDGTVSVGNARDMLAGWVRQGLISQSTAATLTREFGETTRAANTLGRTDPEVRVSAPGYPEARRGIEGVTGAAQIAARQRPNVRVSATDRASGIINNVSRLLFNLDGRRATTTIETIQRTIFQQINAGSRPTGRQHGGPVQMGEAYIVGERHAELFIPREDGYILPNVPPTTAGAPWGGVGGGSYADQRTINIYTGADPQQVVEAIKRYERSNGKGWRAA
jgi:hypothetical protein